MLQLSHWKKPKNVLAGSIYLVSRNMHISSFFTHCWHSMNHFLLYYSRSLSLNPLNSTLWAEQQEQGEKTDSRSLNYSVWTGKRLLPSGPKVCSLVNHYVAPPAVTPLSLFVSMENWKKKVKKLGERSEPSAGGLAVDGTSCLKITWNVSLQFFTQNVNAARFARNVELNETFLWFSNSVTPPNHFLIAILLLEWQRSNACCHLSRVEKTRAIISLRGQSNSFCLYSPSLAWWLAFWKEMSYTWHSKDPFENQLLKSTFLTEIHLSSHFCYS